MSTAKANSLCARFEGRGPNIYIMKMAAWMNWLGEERGSGVYAMLLSVREGEGGVPGFIKLNHGGGVNGMAPACPE